MVQETSLTAYRADVLPSLGSRQAAVLNVIQSGRNWTNSEIAASLGWTINRVTGRVFELRKLGKVRVDEKRTCRRTGRTCIAWTAVYPNTLF